MGKGKKALDGILELAEDDESARTFEVAGHSGIRSLAGLAVFGCMLAALGSLE